MITRGFTSTRESFYTHCFYSFITHANGTSTSTTFDELNCITLIEHSDNANTVLASFTYTLDPTGRRTQITEEDGRTSSYTYDDLYRLITEAIIDPVNGNHNATWTYDAVGNRLSDTTNGVTASYSYDTNDRLLTQGSQSFTYDDRGSTLSESDGITTDTFVYDSRNKLVEAMVEGSLLTMSYDMDGNRVGKTVNNVPVNYVVDNNQAYAQVVVEEQAADTLDYTFGTDLLSLDSASGEYTYHTDALGSNRLVTDSAGSSADELGYDAWGEVLAGGDLAENAYRYTGEQFDSDLDKVYLRARYLDTDRGGFTQMDDWVGNHANPITLNKYLYGNADSLNRIDPTGNFSILSTLSRIDTAATIYQLTTSTYNGLFADNSDEDSESDKISPFESLLIYSLRSIGNSIAFVQTDNKNIADATSNIEVINGEGHHTIPIYLCGHKDQEKSTLERELHREIHAKMLTFEKTVKVAGKAYKILLKKRSKGAEQAPLQKIAKKKPGRIAIASVIGLFYSSGGYMEEGSPTIRKVFTKESDRFVNKNHTSVSRNCRR